MAVVKAPFAPRNRHVVWGNGRSWIVTYYNDQGKATWSSEWLNSNLEACKLRDKLNRELNHV